MASPPASVRLDTSGKNAPCRARIPRAVVMATVS
jgi:hypothetical protein